MGRPRMAGDGDEGWVATGAAPIDGGGGGARDGGGIEWLAVGAGDCELALDRALS